MPSLSPKDRISLCLFTYEDGRRCRTPRINSHPHFCFYHAQKESQSQSTEKLAKELAYFLSGDYLSANDLNTALGRLIPAVLRGEIKPRVARTVAYMLQTLMQSTRQAQHEYINAFSTDGWRDAISTSVKANHKYLHPPKPKQPTQSPAPPATPAPVGAGLVHSACPEERREPLSTRPASPTAPPDHTTQLTPPPPHTRPSPADTEAALAAARALFPPSPTAAESNDIPPAAAPSEAHYTPRRRHYNPPTNSFATYIYTRPAGF